MAKMVKMVGPGTMRISKAGTWTSRRIRDGSAARAFTLVELIVVLIVLGTTVGLAFPKLSGLMLREPEPWRSGRQLARLAKHARELAVVTESTFVLSIDANTGDYWLASKPHDKEAVAVTAPSDLRGRLSEDVRITDIELTGEDWDPENTVMMEFGPEGSCDPVTVCLTSAEGWTVRVVIREGSDEIDLVGDERAG
jgi:prepilin-type N-terminal cleavage/methylation domain-containing protein